MVLGVPGRIDGDEGPIRVDRNGLTVLQDMEPFSSRWGEATVEGVEERSVDLRCGVDQLGGIGEVTSTLLVHVDGGVREVLGDVPHSTGVVQVNVGHDDTSQVLGSKAHGLKCCEHRRHRRLRSGLDQNWRRSRQQVAGGDLGPSPESSVDLEDPVGDRRHRGDVVPERIVVVVDVTTEVVVPAHN